MTPNIVRTENVALALDRLVVDQVIEAWGIRDGVYTVRGWGGGPMMAIADTDAAEAFIAGVWVGLAHAQRMTAHAAEKIRQDRG